MSTISSALVNSVSGLKAESNALSTVANNLANSSTSGYKSNRTRFADLVTAAAGGGTNGAGVTANTRQNVTLQGNVANSSNDTDLAISGRGFFCLVKTDAGTGAVASTEYFYSRDGEFSLNDKGFLTLGNDYYLEGYAATYDPVTGTTTLSTTPSALGVDPTGSAWKATSSLKLNANLPESLSVAALGGNVSSVSATVEIYNASGASEMVTLTFTPDSVMSDEWTMALSSSDPSLTFSPGSHTVTFGSGGGISAIDGVSGSSLSSAIGGGAGSQTVSFDFSDLTQYDRGSNDIKVSSTDQNGYIKSKYSKMSVASDGTVSATYGSGLSVTVGQIALANFANANGLTVRTGNVYQTGLSSGEAMIGKPGQNGTGTLASQALEGSTTDTGTEFSRMIVSQQAYSAASQVVATCKEMYGTLANLKT